MKKISIIIMVLVVALASCKKTPEVNLKYVDVERDLVTVGTTTANIQCDYAYITTLKKAYLYYGEGGNETNMTSAEMRVVQNTLYVELTGLKENTTYSYYYEFHNGFNSMRTALKSFKTEASPITPPEIMLPTVIAIKVTEITTSSAQCGGEVTNDGGSEVTERGICWSTNANPTISDSHVAAGTGMGAFTAAMGGLEANTTYHVRAYAINEMGTAYGLDVEFTTLDGGSNAPEGAINGLFTINENGDQVYFSQGNLQYQASTNTWRFAEHQWDYVGGTINGIEYGTVYESGVKCNNSLISSSYSGWIDLFGWGTSGWHDSNDSRNVNYQPWSTSYSYNFAWDATNPYGYGPSLNMPSPDLINSSANYDWGIYNPISNGGNQSNQWRTLSMDESGYVFNTRSTSTGIRYAKAVVNEVNGVILLPDDWSSSNFMLNDTNNDGASYSSNSITASEWNMLEQFGAVFLPITNLRAGTSVEIVENVWAGYWLSSRYGSGNAYKIQFSNWSLEPQSIQSRCSGMSVRLIQDANP